MPKSRSMGVASDMVGTGIGGTTTPAGQSAKAIPADAFWKSPDQVNLGATSTTPSAAGYAASPLDAAKRAANTFMSQSSIGPDGQRQYMNVDGLGGSAMPPDWTMSPKMYSMTDIMPTTSRSVAAMKQLLDEEAATNYVGPGASGWGSNPNVAPPPPMAPAQSFGAPAGGGGPFLGGVVTPARQGPQFQPPSISGPRSGVNPGQAPAGPNPVEAARQRYGIGGTQAPLPRPQGAATAPTYAGR